jgi:hypothetical protein
MNPFLSILTLLALVFVCANSGFTQEPESIETITEPQEEPSIEQEAPRKRKSYSQRYKEYFSDGDYAKKYRESHSRGNYRDWYVSTGRGSGRSRYRYSFADGYYHNQPSYGSFSTYPFYYNSDRYYRDQVLKPLNTPSIIQPFSHSRKALSVPPSTTRQEPQTRLSPGIDDPPREIVLWRDPLFLSEEFRDMYFRAKNEESNQKEEETLASRELESPEPPKTEPETRELLSPSQLLYSQGIEAFQSRNYVKAHRLFSSLTTISPEEPKYQVALGYSYLALGNYKKAEGQLKQNQSRTDRPASWDEFYRSERDFLTHQNKLQRFIDKYPEISYAQNLNTLLSQYAP